MGLCLSKNFQMRYEEGSICIKRITYKWSGDVAWYHKKKKKEGERVSIQGHRNWSSEVKAVFLYRIPQQYQQASTAMTDC